MPVFNEPHYNSLSDKTGFKKYWEVKVVPNKYGKSFPTIVQCLYCDTDIRKIFKSSYSRWILDDGSITLSVGQILPPTENPATSLNFVDFDSTYREYHSDEELIASIRISRNYKLGELDSLVMRHLSQPENAKTLTEAQYAELQGYMQALRDFPANVNLDNIIWPPKPAFMA